MTDRSTRSELSAISIAELRRFLISSGFTVLGPWGRYLERFHLQHGDDQFDVLVPTTTDIADYRDRIRDAVADLSRALSQPVDYLARQITTVNYKTFRLRAHPGAEISSLPFDEGYGILSNGKSLIKASAVSAYSTRHRKIIRGRSTASVDEYMDRVRIGQSEVGSYVFNLLLPNEDFVFEGEHQSHNKDIVIDSLQRNIDLAAEMAATNRVPTVDRLEKAGMSANFCEALYNIIDWSENIVLEISEPGNIVSERYCRSFDRTNLSVLERTAAKLAPEEQPAKKTISGTITRLSEPANRRRGSIELLTKIEGRRRSVRIPFGVDDRETIITAFKEKSSRLLTVTGNLKTERNGHLALENPENFDASKRGSLI